MLFSYNVHKIVSFEDNAFMSDCQLELDVCLYIWQERETKDPQINLREQNMEWAALTLGVVLLYC